MEAGQHLSGHRCTVAGRLDHEDDVAIANLDPVAAIFTGCGNVTAIGHMDALQARLAVIQGSIQVDILEHRTAGRFRQGAG